MMWLTKCTTLPILAFLVAACAGDFDYVPPAREMHTSDYERVFDAPIDEVWSATIKAIDTDEDFELVLAEPDMALLVVDPGAVDKALIQYVDCGLIEGKPASEGLFEYTTVDKSGIFLGQGRIGDAKLRAQSIIRFFDENFRRTRVEVDSNYDIFVGLVSEERGIGTASGVLFSRAWVFATGGENTQKMLSRHIESISCRPTHGLERHLIRLISESLGMIP